MKLKEKTDALQMYSLGYSQKEIAQKVNVAEKTIGAWVKKWKLIDKNTNEIIENIKSQLLELSRDKEAPKHEIMYLSTSIKRLQETLIIKPFIANAKPKKRNRSI